MTAGSNRNGTDRPSEPTLAGALTFCAAGTGAGLIAIIRGVEIASNSAPIEIPQEPIALLMGALGCFLAAKNYCSRREPQNPSDSQSAKPSKGT